MTDKNFDFNKTRDALSQLSTDLIELEAIMKVKHSKIEEKNKEVDTEEKNYAFNNIIKKNENSRAWSVAAVIVGVIAILLFRVSVVGMILAIASVCLSVISRKILGYFDGFAIAGLIVGIFGIVFALFGFVFDYMINNTIYFKIFLGEIGLL